MHERIWLELIEVLPMQKIHAWNSGEFQNVNFTCWLHAQLRIYLSSRMVIAADPPEFCDNFKAGPQNTQGVLS